MTIDPITQHIMEKEYNSINEDEETVKQIAKYSGRLLIVLAAIYLAYKRKKKAGESICDDKEGEEKKGCLEAYRMGAYEFRLKALKKVDNDVCAKDKNPAACRKRLSAETSKVQQKINKLKIRIRNFKRKK